MYALNNAFKFISSQAKQIELQFTVGEAITNAAIGTSSLAARDLWMVAEREYTPPDSKLKTICTLMQVHSKC